MISIYLRPDDTQVVKGKLNKDSLTISFSDTLESFWDALMDENFDLSILFRRVENSTTLKKEEVYIVLPDTLFSLVDCYEYSSDEGLNQVIRDSLHNDIENYYVITPFVSEPAKSIIKTVYVIEKKYVLRLVEAAKKCGIYITSIEASSAAFFRCMNRWNLDASMVEIFDHQAYIASFSPTGGIFRNEVPELSYSELKPYKDSGNIVSNVFGQAYIQNIRIASSNFMSSRTDAEYIVLTNHDYIKNADVVRQYSPANTLRFPNNVKNSIILEDEEVLYFSAVGTMLQHEKLDKFIYSELPAFFTYGPANILPKDIQENAKRKQFIKFINTLCMALSGLFLTTSVITGAAALYFYSVEVPADLQNDHANLREQYDKISSEVSILNNSKKYDQHLMEAYSDVLNAKPQSCSFTSIALGADNINGNEAIDRWISFNVVSTDEVSFQDYIANLKKLKGPYLSPSIVGISISDSAFRSADITIGRKGMAAPSGEGNGGEGNE